MALLTPKEQAAADLAAHYSTGLPWVQTVTYTPKGGQASSVAAIVKRRGEDSVNESMRYDALFKVRVSEVPNRPKNGDAIVSQDNAGQNETWKLDRDAEGTPPGEWICKVKRAVRPTFRR
jgi:hypothetical protein